MDSHQFKYENFFSNIISLSQYVNKSALIRWQPGVFHHTLGLVVGVGVGGKRLQQMYFLMSQLMAEQFSLWLVQVSQYTFAMCSYREKKAEPVELLQLDGYTVDYTDPQPGNSSRNTQLCRAWQQAKLKTEKHYSLKCKSVVKTPAHQQSNYTGIFTDVGWLGFVSGGCRWLHSAWLTS